MRYRVYIIVLILLVASAALVPALGASWQWPTGLCIAALVVCILLYRSIWKPLHAVENGMYLLREQDFGSRLRHTGQKDADDIVELYNTLIDSMKAERLKVQEQNRFLGLLINASPMGIAVCGFNGDIEETNRAWNRMQSPALSKAIAEIKDGETATVRLADALIVRISRLWFMDSGFRRRFILVERLTDEIAAAEKQMFNKIVRTIGHEVNNTLGSVISILETLEEMHRDDSLESATIRSSRNSCANLTGFVRAYADIVKLPPPSPEPVDINGWLEALMPSLSGMVPSNVTLRFAPLPSSGTAVFDPMLMERVMVNIVKNSVESIGDSSGGNIDIAVTPCSIPGPAYRLTVTDNGKGISDEAATRLFTPFFSTKRPDRGLGLMLITDILRSHHFSFSLATSRDDGLTTFSIILTPQQ